MPDLSSVQDDIRASGYDFDGFLNTPPREIVLEGTVTLVPSDPVMFLIFNTTGGDYTDVQEHMEVEVFSSTGVSKGRLRVAAWQEITNTVLPVNEHSTGRMKVIVGDTFVVYREWRLRDLLVGASLTFPKDSRIPYSDQNALVAPLPLTGGHWAGKCDPGEGYATVPFFGTLSRIMDSDSGGDKEYLWDVKDGTIVTGDATTGDIVVQFPPGKRWIDFTVTDSGNGKSATQHIFVIVEDDDHPPIPCSMEELSGTRVDGWRMRFSVPLAMYAALAVLPDGQLIICHKDEWRSGALSSYGNPIAGRSRIKCIAFLVSETVEIDSSRGVITFEAVSPLAILSQLPGFSQALLEANTPVDWQHYRGLTVVRALVYLVVWGTTLPVLFDFDVTGLDDRPFAELFIQQNTPYLQLMELIDGLSSELVCDRSGRFFASRRLNRASPTVRNNADTLLVLGAADVVGMRITRAHRYRSAQLEGKGFTQGANGQPVLSIAPGEAPAEAPDFTSVDRLIVASQAELNDVTGWAYAEENSLYNGVPVPAEIEIDLRGGYDVGDFYPQWVQLDGDLVEELALLWRALNREQVAADVRLQINAIAATMDDGGKRVTWTCAHETIGEPGKTQVPEVDDSGYYDDPWLEFPPLSLSPSLPSFIGHGVGRIALITANRLIRTTDFQTPAADGGPTWADGGAWNALGVVGTVLQWVPNGFEPGAGWLFTNTRIYYLRLATGEVTLLHIWSATVKSVSADASFAEAGFVVAIAYIQGVGSIAAHSANGVNFAEVTISSHYATDGATAGSPEGIINGCYVSSKAPGKVLTSVFTSTAGYVSIAAAGRVSTNYGASWGTQSNPSIASDTRLLAQMIHVPWNANPSEVLLYYTRITAASDHHFMRANGASSDEITPTISGNAYAPRGARDSIASSVANRQRMLVVGQRPGAHYAVFLSNDGFDSYAVIEADGTDMRHCAIAGDDPNTAWLWGNNNAIAQLQFMGTSVLEDSRTGNLVSLSAGSIIAIAGY